MSRVQSYMNQENLQTEVAILQKKILAFKPCYARLLIPALMGDGESDDDNYITVPMPMNVSIAYGSNVIPEGTKFIVQAVAGNYNDIRIIGFYDEPKSFNFIQLIGRLIASPASSLPSDYGTFKYDEIK